MTNTKKFAFDLDEVIRGLQSAVCSRLGLSHTNITDWHQLFRVGKEELNFIDATKLTDLETAAPTKYYGAILTYMQAHKTYILTAQPKAWIPHTEKWIDKHILKYIPRENLDIRIFDSALDKHNFFTRMLKPDGFYLIEDFPNFPDYAGIILIDMPHNRKIKDVLRITTVGQLTQVLKGGSYGVSIEGK